MIKFLLICILLFNLVPAFADYVTTSNSLYNNGFRSKLKMNQPKIIMQSPSISTRPYYGYPSRYSRYRTYDNYGYPAISRSNLSALEKYALRKTYGRESELQRLERLENLAFGAIQNGNPSIRFKNVENAILSRPQYNTKQSLLNNISNYFSGQSTGFTPPIATYPNYTNFGGFTTNPYMFPKYNNTSFEQYSNGIFGGGWGFSGQDFGTGSSVKILD